MKQIRYQWEENNYTLFALTLRKLILLFEDADINNIAEDIVWNIVPGVLPFEFDGREDEIMEHNRKDGTADKIDNLYRIVHLAEYVIAGKYNIVFSVQAAKLLTFLFKGHT